MSSSEGRRLSFEPIHSPNRPRRGRQVLALALKARGDHGPDHGARAGDQPNHVRACNPRLGMGYAGFELWCAGGELPRLAGYGVPDGFAPAPLGNLEANSAACPAASLYDGPPTGRVRYECAGQHVPAINGRAECHWPVRAGHPIVSCTRWGLVSERASGIVG
jgi:hypothetical protein